MCVTKATAPTQLHIGQSREMQGSSIPDDHECDSSTGVSTPLKSLLSAENESCAPFSNNGSKTYKVMMMSCLIKVLRTHVTFATQKASAAQINAVQFVSFFSHNSHHYKPRENWIVFLASRFPRYAWVPTHFRMGAPTSRLHFRALCAITSPTLNTECGL